MTNPAQTPIQVHGFTIRANGITNVIIMDVEIAAYDSAGNYNTQIKVKAKGIIDTGATATVVTQRIIDELSLLPTGMTKVNTASESGVETNTYLTNVYLKPDLCITSVKVTRGKITGGIDCLIGMDILTLGDFSITNHGGNTCMSFRIPSLVEVDYVKELQEKEKQMHNKLGRNDPCHCGSGKKFKNCHGANR